MTIYLDSEYHCHLTNDGTRRAVVTDVFDGKCAAYIEGYRFVPAGESWTREDGVIFQGEMIAAAEDYSGLEKAQKQYKLDELARWDSLGIPQEDGFTATRNYPAKSFLAIQGQLYETTISIPKWANINLNDVLETTIEHYLETLERKEE